MTAPYEVTIHVLSGETVLYGNALRFEAIIRDAHGSLASLTVLKAEIVAIDAYDGTLVPLFSFPALPVQHPDGYVSPGRYAAEIAPVEPLPTGEYLIRFYAPYAPPDAQAGHVLGEERFRVIALGPSSEAV